MAEEAECKADQGTEAGAAANKQAEQRENGPQGDQGEAVKDKHGHPGISEGKYNRDIAAKDAEIADLRRQVENAAKTEEGRKALEQKIEALEKSQADERVTHALELAGCKSVKAAKALLDDFGGDVAKLKAEHPYLFDDGKPKGSLGAKPGGATTMTRRQIMDIKDKGERLKAIAENISLFED